MSFVAYCNPGSWRLSSHVEGIRDQGGETRVPSSHPDAVLRQSDESAAAKACAASARGPVGFSPQRLVGSLSFPAWQRPQELCKISLV